MKLGHLELEQLKALLAAIPNPRHRLMLKVAYHHGLRATEVVGDKKHPGLRAAQCRNGMIYVKRRKGSLATTQPFESCPDAPWLSEAEELEELLKTLKPNDKLFPMTRFGFYKLMQRAAGKANVNKAFAHPHILKHSVAMHTIEEGIEYTRQLLGHASLSSTGYYLRVTDQAASEAKKRALKKRLAAI